LNGEEQVRELSDRRSQTAKRIEDLRNRLKAAEAIAGEKTCVYMTGSFGRCEASMHSDLDLFIIGKGSGKPGRDGKPGSQLSRLEEIRIMADLIEVNQEVGIPPFSGDGRWLDHYSVDDLIQTLGTPEDDVQNTFTARLLLLLESRPLLGDAVYRDVLDGVIAKYWRDYEDHRTDFTPAFLANDILRLWRTFCVNYEARTERGPEHEKAKGKIKNYKLKHSRLLTCFSGVLYLLGVYNQYNSVHPADARAMIALTPTHRLEWLRDQAYLVDARNVLSSLLARYEKFLETTNASEGDLINRFMDPVLSRQFIEAASQFGDVVFDALEGIGKRSHFHRLLVV
jgi:predicted nucleotidyltransferase